MCIARPETELAPVCWSDGQPPVVCGLNVARLPPGLDHTDIQCRVGLCFRGPATLLGCVSREAYPLVGCLNLTSLHLCLVLYQIARLGFQKAPRAERAAQGRCLTHPHFASCANTLHHGPQLACPPGASIF